MQPSGHLIDIVAHMPKKQKQARKLGPAKAAALSVLNASTPTATRPIDSGCS